MKPGPNQQKWIDALKSGEFKQGKDTLDSGGGFYCCLGVACVVAEREGVKVSRQNGDGYLWGDDLHSQAQVMLWLGLSNPAGAPNDDGYRALTSLNDNDDYSFAQIACVLEASPSTYFTQSC